MSSAWETAQLDAAAAPSHTHFHRSLPQHSGPTRCAPGVAQRFLPQGEEEPEPSCPPPPPAGGNSNPLSACFLRRAKAANVAFIPFPVLTQRLPVRRTSKLENSPVKRGGVKQRRLFFSPDESRRVHFLPRRSKTQKRVPQTSHFLAEDQEGTSPGWRNRRPCWTRPPGPHQEATPSSSLVFFFTLNLVIVHHSAVVCPGELTRRVAVLWAG